MQPRGPFPEENIFVAVQRDNLPPLRVNTAMNIGRCQTTVKRSRKKAKTATYAADCSGAARGIGRGGGRAGKTRGRGRKKGRGRGEQSHVAHEELNSTQSAPGEY